MIDVDKLASECTCRLRAGANELEVIRSLRDAGLTKIQTIHVLATTGRWSLADAKKIVHESPVWADLKRRDEAFVEDLVRSTKDSKG